VTANGASFGYDANGNLISKTDASGNWTYTWDYENRLKQASKASRVTVTYAYDALGRRVQRTSSSVGTTKFVYDGADVVRDLDGSGNTVADYLNGPGIDNKLRQTASGAVSYFACDHLGTTSAIIDASGSLNSTLNYDSFGNVIGGSASTRYTYTGRELDPDIGFTYYRARWYDPQQGRFISEDPIGFWGGIHLYAYVGNRVPNLIDPLGTERLSYTQHAPQPILSKDDQRWWHDFWGSLFGRPTYCCKKTWTDCYAQCVENNRLDNLFPLLISAVPKSILPPFRVVEPSQRLTTPLSSAGHLLRKVAPQLAEDLRGIGRSFSRVGTPLLVFEGFYDWGIIGSCAELCHRNPCN
jgi:RHS repeat-associated protein